MTIIVNTEEQQDSNTSLPPVPRVRGRPKGLKISQGLLNHYIVLYCPELQQEREALQRALLPHPLRTTRDFTAATADPACTGTVVRWLLATGRLPEYRRACRYAAIQDQEEGEERGLE